MARIHNMPPMPLLADPPLWNDHDHDYLVPKEMGRSLLGNPINLYHPRQANLLVMGGVHGDESEGIFLAHLLIKAQREIPVVACLNPDGALLRQRWNSRNVDLNRNLPTPDWHPEPLNDRYPPGAVPASEPETQAFLNTLDFVRPQMVLSLHSYKESFVEIERPPDTLAPAMNTAVLELAESLAIERRLSIGYLTPGALGSYGKQHGLLIFTYELLRGASHGELHQQLPPLLRFIQKVDGLGFTPRDEG